MLLGWNGTRLLESCVTIKCQTTSRLRFKTVVCPVPLLYGTKCCSMTKKQGPCYGNEDAAVVTRPDIIQPHHKQRCVKNHGSGPCHWDVQSVLPIVWPHNLQQRPVSSEYNSISIRSYRYLYTKSPSCPWRYPGQKQVAINVPKASPIPTQDKC